jgi:hypothetical protein
MDDNSIEQLGINSAPPGASNSAPEIQVGIELPDYVKSGGDDQSFTAATSGGSENQSEAKSMRKVAVLPEKPERIILEVRSAIEERIKQLQKQARKECGFFGVFDPVKFQGFVKQIRHLISVLASLAGATVETLKSLWYEHVTSNSGK